MDFAAEQIATGVNYVIERAGRRNGQTVTYSDVFQAAGLPDPEELSEGERSRYMEQFHEYQQNYELPPLDALVVRKSGDRRGVPGAGYFRVNGLPDPIGQMSSVSSEEIKDAIDYWRREQDRCWDWGRNN